MSNSKRSSDVPHFRTVQTSHQGCLSYISPNLPGLSLPLESLLHRYVPALFALDELLLLAPHDAFFVLQHAETAHTAGQYSRAYAGFLRVMEMCGSEIADKGSKDGKSGKREGPWVRALWGVKAVSFFRDQISSLRHL